MRVAVLEGAGRLAPEEVRELLVEFHFSHRLTAGHTLSRDMVDFRIKSRS